MNIRLPCCAALLWCLAIQCMAAEQHCTDRPECWPEGSGQRTRLERGEQAAKLDSELAARHSELVTLFGSSQVKVRNITLQASSGLLDALRDQQKAWVVYSGAECWLDGARNGGGDQWQAVHAAECSTQLAKQRLQVVTTAIQCIQKIPAADRYSRQNACLEPLVLLSYKEDTGTR